MEEMEELRPANVHGQSNVEILRRRPVGGNEGSVGSGAGARKDQLSKPENTDKDGSAKMRELSEMVRAVYKGSSWWERHGLDWTIIASAFCLLLGGFLCLRSRSLLLCTLGIVFLGLAHAVFSIKGAHMASHRTLCQSRRWGKFWATFFMEVCSCVPAQCGEEGHVKMHHGYTNIIGLGDSSIWKVPYLSCGIYMFVAPLALPLLTVLIGLKYIAQMPLFPALRSLFWMVFGLWASSQLLLHVSGLSYSGTLGCLLLSRALFAVPFIHVNIFQHIGLPMFSVSNRPHRLQLMTNGVLNLPRNLLLDWTFGHSLISCHVEHHLFPHLSDNMCLKVKPLVSKYVRDHNLPYHEDSYTSRLQFFLSHYEELMVLAPPIAQLVEFH